MGMMATPIALASDLSEALLLTQEVMGSSAIEGFEEFIDEDPNEALKMLLGRESDDELVSAKRVPAFQQLGDKRLEYRAVAYALEEAMLETGIPVALLDAVIRTESGYRPEAVSYAGAIGLMQLMPATAGSVGVSDPTDPHQNILGGARYLRRMYDRFGSVRLALAAYNAGPAVVARYGGMPPFKETTRYVEVVLNRYENSAHHE